MKLVDLDKLVSPDIKVRLAGNDYILPGDLPADLYLEVNLRSQSGETTEFESIQDMHEKILRLFRYKQPNLDSIPGLSLKQLVLAIATIYGDAGEEEETPARPPRRRASGGATRTGKRQPKTSSRR